MKVYKFYADWCQPCHAMEPIFNALQNDPQFDGIDFKQVDIDGTEDCHLVSDWKIRTIPTFIFADDDNNPIKRISGSMPLEYLTNFIKEGMELCQKQL